ncbi:hypothetical protein HY792_00440 [Candidatus Desantisbacteria bacterium]|nr:hypothetical protein [Candidatus Desantisbacteria bacterium]
MWNWDHSRLRASILGSRIEKSTAPLTAVVRLKLVETKDDEVCVDVVVKNVSDLLAGEFVNR